jgi:hypothetical protein
MDTTTTDNFTKELFYALRLDWDSYAEARLLLTTLIDREENLNSILEDVVFALSKFLDQIRKDRNIPKTDNQIIPFFERQEDNYCLHIGNNDKSNIVFIVLEVGDGYIFQRALDYTRLENNPCYSLEDLKLHLLLWFNEFYEKYEEGTL